MVEAINPNSALNQFFAQFNVSEEDKLKNDKLFQGLLKLNDFAQSGQAKICNQLFIK